ncbi:MAG: response regulator [Desulfotignum sp.]|nr:response regulator [Desulfotignum sp.]MCF8086727.1 response regulator [Desulfotignum sp.]MCF8136507.1 response regulator [Desulfotignum sp.]
MTFTVLVVDDVKENIDVLSHILSDHYRVKAATSGEMALTVARKTLPDIILLDIMMPGMDGYDTCRRLKQIPETRNIPVIFVTAKNQVMDEVKGFETGAVDYIGKPVNPVITLARVKTHIALSNQKKCLEIQVQEQTREIRETRLEIIRKLGRAAEYKDNDTGLHVERMSRYTYLIATAYGLDDHESQLVLQASPMHDIGKIGVPDMVLKKPGRLTVQEWNLMDKHPLIGGRIIGESRAELLQAARIIAEQHHERWDGTGYPYRLKADEIHVYARLTSVADVFDALTSRRPYKAAWDIDAAVDLIQDQKGKQFDPAVVDAFSAVLPDILNIKHQFAETSAETGNQDGQ